MVPGCRGSLWGSDQVLAPNIFTSSDVFILSMYHRMAMSNTRYDTYGVKLRSPRVIYGGSEQGLAPDIFASSDVFILSMYHSMSMLNFIYDTYGVKLRPPRGPFPEPQGSKAPDMGQLANQVALPLVLPT